MPVTTTILKLKSRFVVEVLSDTGKFFGMKPLGVSLSALLPENCVSEATDAYNRMLEQQSTQTFYFKAPWKRFSLPNMKEELIEAQLIPLMEEGDVLLSAKIIRNPDTEESILHLRENLTTMFKSFEKVKEAIWILDAGGITTYVNSLAAKILGRESEQLIGRHLFEFVREDFQSKCVEKLQYFPSSSDSEGRQSRFPFVQEGRPDVWALVTSKPVIESNGKRLGTFCVLKDITDIERSGQALFESAVQLAKQVERMEDKMARKRSRTSFEYHIQELTQKGIFKPCESGVGFEPSNKQRKLETSSENSKIISEGSLPFETIKQHFIETTPLPQVQEKPFTLSTKKTEPFKLGESESQRDSLEDLPIRFVMETAEEGVWFIDEKAITTYVNSKMAEMLGYQPEDIIGKNVDEFLEEDERKIFQEACKNRFKCEKKTIAKDFRLKKKGGSDVWVILSVNPIYLHDTYLGSIAMIKDITTRREMEREMFQTTAKLSNLLRVQTKFAEEQDRERKKAEAADEAKTAFLANMSHEVRTPVNGIVGATELLCQSSVTEEQKSYLDIIKTSANNLLVVLNDILDFSRIESGQISLEISPFDVYQTVYHATRLFSATATKKGIDLKVEIGEDIPRWIRGDGVKIHQVLTNLVSNALKFTSKGCVVVKLEKEFETLNPEKSLNGLCCLHFSVTDTGIGIAEDKMSQLFQRFYQVDSSITRQYGGTGLGLAISKKLISLMGGEIQVRSESNRGSCFSFLLALETSENPSASKENLFESSNSSEQLNNRHEQILSDSFHMSREKMASAENGTRGKYKVLLAEDNALNQKVATKMVEKLGYFVDIVSNGQEALEKVQKNQYALILMDWQMPVMDGLASAQAIRKLGGKESAIPIIALTAHSMPGDREKCLDAGFNAYLTKPIEYSKLSQLLEIWYEVGVKRFE